MLELYHFWDSPCCFKVRLVLAEKGLTWTPRYIATHRFEHFEPGYRRLNRHRKIPTLVHDGVPVIQSSEIARYLDERFPEPGLRPDGPAARATMREWIAEEQEYLFPLIVTLSFNLMMKLRGAGFGREQLEEWSRRHPDRERAQDYLRRVSGPPDHAAVAAAAAGFRWHMEHLEQVLAAGGGPWICGADYSLADICVAPILDRVESLDLARLWADLPAVGAWYGRMKARPAFGRAAAPFEYRMWGPLKPVPDRPVDAAAAGDTFPSAASGFPTPTS